MKPDGDSLTPLYARLLLRLTRPFPNFDIRFIKPLRARAVKSLQLRAGDRVLDVGCGMGGSFPFLVDAVGPAGEVTGVEISPTTVAHARRRVATNGWTNVGIVSSSAQNVELVGLYDGLVMFAAPDVYASAAALERILPHLRSGARIALFGAKQANGVAGKFFNPLVKLAVTKLSFATTPMPEVEPCRLIEAVTTGLEIREYTFGAMFLAAGSLAEDWRESLELAKAAEAASPEKTTAPVVLRMFAASEITQARVAAA